MLPMRYIVLFSIITLNAFGQLTVERAQDSTRRYHIAAYSYHEAFIGYRDYGAPVYLTRDGGAAVFGDGDDGAMLVKLDKSGNQVWKKVIAPKGEEVESQSVVQDTQGNYFIFQLIYDATKYRGGCERAVMLNKSGSVVWDKFIGSCQLINNPTVSYIKSLPDGRIALRGHVVKEKPPEGMDPTYYFWEGWLNSKGVLTQKTGPVIDWSKQEEWKSRLKPE